MSDEDDRYATGTLRDAAEDEEIEGVYVNDEGYIAFEMAILSKTGVSPPQ